MEKIFTKCVSEYKWFVTAVTVRILGNQDQLKLDSRTPGLSQVL